MSDVADLVFKSDQAQSISPEIVAAIVRRNTDLEAEGLPLLPVPEPGRVCRNSDHGRMLVSLKTMHLECGICGYAEPISQIG